MWPFFPSIASSARHTRVHLRPTLIITGRNGPYRRSASTLKTGHIELEGNEGILYINSGLLSRISFLQNWSFNQMFSRLDYSGYSGDLSVEVDCLRLP